MGDLIDRHLVVLTKTHYNHYPYYTKATIDEALSFLETKTDHIYVAGGGEVYRQLLPRADILHLSTVHAEFDGDTYCPEIPLDFNCIYSQEFKSNIDYTYQIYKKDSDGKH